jgi:RsiW-degrading membrane proteinase PrsW (M82 family)
MAEHWFYVTDGAQGGPVDSAALPGLVLQGKLKAASLLWREGLEDWQVASELQPSLFVVPGMPPSGGVLKTSPAAAPAVVSVASGSAGWFYLAAGEQKGPLASAGLAELGRAGTLTRDTLVWREGLAGWQPVSHVAELAALLPATSPPVASRPGPPPVPRDGGHGILRNIGVRISQATDLPTISSVPIRDILIGGLDKAATAKEEEIEDQFAVGTRAATPPLSQVETGWPRARVFWRVLAASLATYALLRIGIAQWGNTNLIPGMAFVGSFVVPFSVVILFYELNTPRNVSFYQVLKMTSLGGALSLVSTLLVFQFLPGAGTGAIIPAMLTGVAEETGKALALLLVVGSVRYRWQLNGLVFGSAVGAGFAGLESAGYAFNVGYRSFLAAATRGGLPIGQAFAFGLDQAIDNITLRGLLAPGGHVIWTAMVGSAIWKVKGDRPFSPSMLFHKTVLRRWGAAVVLHGFWDADFPFLNTWIQVGLLIVVGWYIVFAILKDALGEVEAAKAKLAA